MGKRSDFERVEKDYYPTIDLKAGRLLSNHLENENIYYAEPCYGKGHLEENLEKASEKFYCAAYGDIETGQNALEWTTKDVEKCKYIITNPPWSRKILHPMIEHFVSLRPTWLLFDSSWAYTKQAKEYIQEYCTEILVVGRLQWVENTTMKGKDDCSWYKFDFNKRDDTKFYV